MNTQPVPRTVSYTHPTWVSNCADEMIRLYLGGHTTGDISRELGVSTSAIRRHLKMAGVHDPNFNPMRGKGVANGKAQEIYDLYLKGLSALEVGHYFGVSSSTVLLAIKSIGGKPRKGKYHAVRDPG